MSLKIVRYHSFLWLSSVQLSCSVLSNLFQIPDFLIHHKLLEFANLISNKSLISSNHLILCHTLSSCFQSFPESEAFPMSLFFTSGDQSIGASASASVLPMNIQGWFHLGLTGFISLLFKGLSRVFFNTTIQKQQFFSAQLSSQSNSHIHTWLLDGPLLAK